MMHLHIGRYNIRRRPSTSRILSVTAVQKGSTCRVNMDSDKLLALILYRRRLRRNLKNRILWVHPINKSRKKLGAFYNLYPELRKDEQKFFNYFGMSISSYDELHKRLEKHIQRRNTRLRNCIEPEQMLVITLRKVKHSILKTFVCIE